MPPPPTRLRRDLRAILLDGAAFSVMVGGGETYLAPFVLAAGLGEVQAGFIASLPPLAGAVLQLASPAAVRRLQSHRRWVVLCALVQAASFLPLIAAALVGTIPATAAFLVATIYWGAGMSTGPAWNTWIGTLVPRSLRASYFARRTRITQVGTVAGLLAGGGLLAAGKAGGWEMQAYAALFLLSCACRFASAGFLASQSAAIGTIPSPPHQSRLRALKRRASAPKAGITAMRAPNETATRPRYCSYERWSCCSQYGEKNGAEICTAICTASM